MLNLHTLKDIKHKIYIFYVSLFLEIYINLDTLNHVIENRKAKHLGSQQVNAHLWALVAVDT